MNNKLLGLLILLLTFSFSHSYGQNQQANTQDTGIVITQGVGLQGDSLIDISAITQSSADEIFMLKTELQTQKFLKNIFLVALIMMSIILILLLFIYYSKVRGVIKIVEKSEKEIEIRQLQIDKLSLIINNTNDAISIAQADGKIIWANKSFEKIFGFNPENKDVNIFQTNDPDIKKMLEKCRTEHVPVQYTAQMKNDKGEEIWIQRKIIPFVNEKNEIINFAIIDTDYTSLKLATKK